MGDAVTRLTLLSVRGVEGGLSKIVSVTLRVASSERWRLLDKGEEVREVASRVMRCLAGGKRRVSCRPVRLSTSSTVAVASTPRSKLMAEKVFPVRLRVAMTKLDSAEDGV